MINNKLVVIILGLMSVCGLADAQIKSDGLDAQADTLSKPVVLTLEDALKIALSENISVKVADKEIQRTEYARKGTYASLFPKVDANATFQRTIKKQVMYMDFDIGKFGGFGGGSGSSDTSGGSDSETATGGTDVSAGTPSGSAGTVATSTPSAPSGGGIEVGRWNTYNAGVTATMPLINAQLWKSMQISASAVELAVEKARGSRLEMVTQVKQAYYAALMAKEAYKVYGSVYDNAVQNFQQTEKRYKALRASELEYTRAKSNVANAIPNLYNAESSVVLALWQLKAVMGVDLDMNIDIAGSLADNAESMFYDIHQHDSISLDNNTNIRQLEIQVEQLAQTVKLQKYAYLPTLSLAFSYSMNAMANDFNFNEYRWTPYSYVGLSLSIPIFSGGKRYSDVKQARIQTDELLLQKVNTERQLKIAIRQNLTAMETNMKSYQSANEAVELAQKAYDISEKSYNVGKSTITELNDAQLALTQAKLAESQAVYNFLVAKSNLEHTLGYDYSVQN